MKNMKQSILCGAVASALVATTMAPAGVAYALAQEETVYSKLRTDGKASYTLVTSHLINDTKLDKISVMSGLDNIENLNGTESWQKQGQNLTWQAAGKDIYYQGTTEKGLPVSLEISYELNGVEKTLEEVLGQAGVVKIRLKYTNHEKHGGLSTPFVVAMTTVLDESKVRRVEVTNGKVMSNGRNVAVSAIAAPGLYESLGLEELKGSDEVTISFETTSFELGDIYSVVTPKVLDKADLKIFDQLDGMSAKVEKMSESSQELLAGAEALRAGILELRTGVAQTRKKLEVGGGILDDQTITNIKTQASMNAQTSIKNQGAIISASVQQQVVGNDLLMEALKLEAEQICQEKGSVCSEERIEKIQEQLVDGVVASLAQSSTVLALQVADQVASQTAESLAKQLAGEVGEKTGMLLLAPFDAMVGGLDQILDGAERLRDGMERFDREGVQNLEAFVNGRLQTTANKLKALIRLADEYKGFSKRAETEKSETRFVMMVEGQKAK